MSTAPNTVDTKREIEKLLEAARRLSESAGIATPAKFGSSLLSRPNATAMLVGLCFGILGTYLVMTYLVRKDWGTNLKTWEILVWFVGAGAVGGLVNSFIANNFRLPSLVRTEVDGEERLDLGFLANVLAGASAAYFTIWMTNAKFADAAWEHQWSDFTLPTRDILMAFVAGVLGSKVVTSNGTVSLLMEHLGKAAVMKPNPTAAAAVGNATTGVGAVQAIAAAETATAAAGGGPAVVALPPPPAVPSVSPPVIPAGAPQGQLRQLLNLAAVQTRFAEMAQQGVPNPALDQAGTKIDFALLPLANPGAAAAIGSLKAFPVSEVVPHVTFDAFAQAARDKHPAEFAAVPLPVLSEAFIAAKSVAAVLAQILPATPINAQYLGLPANAS